jgi:hypothetical protein
MIGFDVAPSATCFSGNEECKTSVGEWFSSFSSCCTHHEQRILSNPGEIFFLVLQKTV